MSVVTKSAELLFELRSSIVFDATKPAMRCELPRLVVEHVLPRTIKADTAEWRAARCGLQLQMAATLRDMADVFERDAEDEALFP